MDVKVLFDDVSFTTEGTESTETWAERAGAWARARTRSLDRRV